MGRRAVANSCMFCESNPCTCNPVETKKKAPRKKAAPKVDKIEGSSLIVSTVDEINNVPSVSPLEAMRLAALNNYQNKGPRPIDELESDPEAIAAIASLEPILHADEVEKHHFAFTPESTKARASAWKERRAQH